MDVCCSIHAKQSHSLPRHIIKQGMKEKYKYISKCKTIINTRLQYLSDESLKNSGRPIYKKEWTLEPCKEANTPKEKIDYDCGIFVIMFADFLADNLDLNLFSQEDILFYRRKICHATTTGCLSYSK